MNHGRKIVLMFFLTFMTLTDAYPQAGRESQELRIDSLTQFYQANSAYKEGNYPKAIEIYENIIQNGKVSGVVYYNLGNSFFKAGQLGKAILNYERARRLIPRDSDLESNYFYAESLIKRYEETSQENILSRILRQYGDFFTLDEISIILFCLFSFVGVLFLAGIYSPPSKKAMGLINAVLSILFIFNLVQFFGKLETQSSLAIVVKGYQAKFEPKEEATTYFELAEGWKVEILKIEGGWVKIKRQDEKIGWVKKEMVEKI